MTMTSRKLFDAIANPDEKKLKSLSEKISNTEIQGLEQLSKKAIEGVGNKIENEGWVDDDVPVDGDVPMGVRRSLSFTYHHDWKLDSPDFMMLLQSPGNIRPDNVSSRHRKAFESLSYLNPSCSLGTEEQDVELRRKIINVNKYITQNWLVDRKKIEWFLEVCDYFDLINVDVGSGELGDNLKKYINPWSQRDETMDRNEAGFWDSSWKEYEQYLSDNDNRFFNDFYYTNSARHRYYDEEAEYINGEYNTDNSGEYSYQYYVRNEIAEIDPELIFAFGKEAWTTVMDDSDFEITPLGENDSWDNAIDKHPKKKQKISLRFTAIHLT
jgi:hypothetical protein